MDATLVTNSLHHFSAGSRARRACLKGSDVALLLDIRYCPVLVRASRVYSSIKRVLESLGFLQAQDYVCEEHET